MPLEARDLPLGVEEAARLELDVGSTLVGAVDLRGHEQPQPREAEAEHLRRRRGAGLARGWRIEGGDVDGDLELGCRS